MRGRRAGIGALAALVAALAALGAGARASTTARPTPFDYDRSAPLDLALGKTATSGGVVRQSLTFTGAGTDRLGADFVHPASGGPWPLVLWTPGFGNGRGVDLLSAQSLARAGVASLLVDPPAGTYDTNSGCTVEH